MEGKPVNETSYCEQDMHIYQSLSMQHLNSNTREEEEPPVAMSRKISKKQSTWSTPFVVLTVLLSLVMILLVIIICLLLLEHMSQSDTCARESSNTVPVNFTEWVDKIFLKINSNVTQSNGITNLTEIFPQLASHIAQSTFQLLKDSNFTELEEQIIETTRDSAQKLANVVSTLSNLQDTSNSTYQLLQSYPNFTEPDEQIIQITRDLAQKLANVVSTLSNLQDTSNSTYQLLQSYPNFTEPDEQIIQITRDLAQKLANVVSTLSSLQDTSNSTYQLLQSYPNFTEPDEQILQITRDSAQKLVNIVNTLSNLQDTSNSTYQLLQSYPNFTESDEQILQITRDSAQKIINIVNTLSNLQDTSTSTAGVVDDVLLLVQELLVLNNGSAALPTSCKEIKERHPLSPSGAYALASNNTIFTAYCNMDTLCGSGGGWTRLAYLDMSDATQNCPSGFRLYQSLIGGVRACRRPVTSSGSCASVQFPSNGISYSQVCGRVVGYQYASPDASRVPNGNDRYVIDSYYIDGVSITMGPPPRRHVWSLMAGNSEQQNSATNCPCNNGSNVVVQSFIGNNYFCESGNPLRYQLPFLYSSDPLWDGQNCGSLEASCCLAPNLSWFHRKFNTSTTDYLELRVCGNAGTNYEDVPVSFFEIYMK